MLMYVLILTENCIEVLVRAYKYHINYSDLYSEKNILCSCHKNKAKTILCFLLEKSDFARLTFSLGYGRVILVSGEATMKD